MKNKKELSPEQKELLFEILKERFEKNNQRHQNIKWDQVRIKLESTDTNKLWSLHEMERTDGEPDVISYDKATNEYVFYDCAAESPKARRSLCFDAEALASRKANKPKDSALNMATTMGIALLTEEEYQQLQQLGNFDAKTSSWIATPEPIRKLGGAIFADFRFDTVFVYHNGAESYYAGRGFRGSLRI